MSETLAPRPCTLVELDDSRCHWPLAELAEVAVMFCGGDAVRGRCYCGWRLGTENLRSVISI